MAADGATEKNLTLLVEEPAGAYLKQRRRTMSACMPAEMCPDTARTFVLIQMY